MEELGLGTVTRWGKVPAWWLLHPDVDADRFCVLAAMATYADDEGCCDPSQATLARRLKRSRPWVNRVVADLARQGFLEKTIRARKNGGTTSCLYRLVLQPRDTIEGVRSVTPVCPPSDTPRHLPDTSQPELEQIQTTRPDRGSPYVERHGCQEKTVAAVPADWAPSPAAVDKATSMFPAADTTSHGALFVARCRSKGYRYRPDTLDDTWLAWFIEDQRRDAVRRTRDPVRRPVMIRRFDASAVRFDAWAVAATSPRISSAVWS